MKDVERVNALNKMLLNANVVAYGAMMDMMTIMRKLREWMFITTR